jgi:hypothetical protein
MNQETGLSTELHGIISLDKASIKTQSSLIKQRVLDGELDALDVLILAKKGQLAYKQLEDDVKDLAEEKSYGKDYCKHGVDILEKMNGVKYDYSKTNDKEWELLNKSFEDAKKAKDEREAFLKGLSKSMELVDTDTGETYTLYPPIKSGKMGLNLTIK